MGPATDQPAQPSPAQPALGTQASPTSGKPVLRAWPRGLPLGPARRLGLILGGVGLLLMGNAQPAPAQDSACGSSDSATEAPLDAACCPDYNVLKAYWPERSPQINQLFCQLLLFPKASVANGEEFSQQIVDGSLSSDSRRASPETMTLPSLWWNRDLLTRHLGGRRLVQSWTSYQIKDSDTAVADVVVNPQMWSVLTYSERFAVLNQFGTAARDFGYNLRFFHGNANRYRMVGLYACDFAPSPEAEAEPGRSPVVNTCSANLDTIQMVQIQRNLFAAQERRQQLRLAEQAADRVAADPTGTAASHRNQ